MFVGSKGGMAAAQTESWVGESGSLLSNPKPMEASLMEAGARLLVTSFLGRYISTRSYPQIFQKTTYEKDNLSFHFRTLSKNDWTSLLT